MPREAVDDAATASTPTADDDIETADGGDETTCEDGWVSATEQREPSWAPPASDARVTESRSESDEPGAIEWPFDSVTSALQWWYRPFVQSESWLALAYLFVGLLLGPLLFAFTIAVVSTTASLVVVAVGLLLVVPAFAAVNAFAGLERRRAAWVGEPIPARQLRTAGQAGWTSISTRLNDPARWRQVAYLLLMLIAGPIFFVLGLLPWAVIAQVIVSENFDEFSGFGLIVGAILIGGAPRLTRLVAELARSFAAWFLGPDPSVDLEERVVELSSQREQILDAVANERRRIERNLHDGVQQQLVALGIDIGRAHSKMDDDPDGAKALLGEARDKVRGSIGELRLIGRGLHPAVLSDRGLDAALSAVVASAPIPISVDVSTRQQLPTDVAETSYYVVNEAVANVLKHARARTAAVRVADEPGLLPAVRITVDDDGRGGADAMKSTGSGLAGIAARVSGVDGVFELDSPPGGPTTLTAVIPIRRARLDMTEEAASE